MTFVLKNNFNRLLTRFRSKPYTISHFEKHDNK
eukprot:UN18511